MTLSIINLILQILILLGVIKLGCNSVKLAKRNRDLMQENLALKKNLLTYRDKR